jgi:hypothetical protein
MARNGKQEETTDKTLHFVWMNILKHTIPPSQGKMFSLHSNTSFK